MYEGSTPAGSTPVPVELRENGGDPAAKQVRQVFSGAGFWRTATRTGLPEPSKRALNFCQTDFSLTPTIPD